MDSMSRDTEEAGPVMYEEPVSITAVQPCAQNITSIPTETLGKREMWWERFSSPWTWDCV